MSQAHGNPDELRTFAGGLTHYIDALEQETGILQGAFQRLGDTWDDQKKTAFEDVFQQLLSAMDAFKENAQEQVPYLQQLAEDLDTYLQR